MELLFEVPDVDEKDLKFSDKIRPSPLLKYFNEYRKVRTELKEHMKDDKELEYIYKTTRSNLDGRIDVSTSGDILDSPTLIMEYLYMPKHIGDPKRGILVQNKKNFDKYIARKDPVPFFVNSPPTPEKKRFDDIFFVIMLDLSKIDDPSGKYEEDLHLLKEIIPNHLKIGGRALFLPEGYPTLEGLSFPFVLKLFFKKVFIHKTGQLVALDYNGKKLEGSGYPYFTKSILDLYTPFAKDSIIYRIKLNKKLIKPDKKDFFRMFQIARIENKKLLGIPLTKIDSDYLLFSINEFQKNPYDYKKYIKAAVGKEEGKYLFNLIDTNRLKNIAEVGFANGISAAYMLVGLQEIDGHLISIDPFQTVQWKDAGSKLVKDMKQSKRHKLIQKKSHVALPELLEKYGEESFDMVFIDGWHTFDYTLLDAFYAEKLVRKGGYIIIDDALHPGVNACVKYMANNWKHLHYLTTGPKTFGKFRKMGDDKRDWFFHHVF